MLPVVPKDTLTILISNRSLFSNIHSVPFNTLETMPFPLLSNTLTAAIQAFGAIPLYFLWEAVPSPAIIPETCVPCPESS